MSSVTALKIGFRVVFVTTLFAILGFALGGFLGIVSVGIMQAAHAPTHVQDAIWFGAVPGGAVGAVVGFAVILWSERKNRAPSLS